MKNLTSNPPTNMTNEWIKPIELSEKDKQFLKYLMDKIQHLEAKLKAADEVIEKSKNLCTYTTYPRHKESYKQALEKYNNLKTKV